MVEPIFLKIDRDYPDSTEFLCYFNGDGIGIIYGQISIVLCCENGKSAVFRWHLTPCYGNQAQILVHKDWFLDFTQKHVKMHIFGQKSKLFDYFMDILFWEIGFFSPNYNNF